MSKVKVSQSVSQWQGHLSSCCGQLKTKNNRFAPFLLHLDIFKCWDWFGTFLPDGQIRQKITIMSSRPCCRTAAVLAHSEAGLSFSFQKNLAGPLSASIRDQHLCVPSTNVLSNTSSRIWGCSKSARHIQRREYSPAPRVFKGANKRPLHDPFH